VHGKGVQGRVMCKVFLRMRNDDTASRRWCMSFRDPAGIFFRYRFGHGYMPEWRRDMPGYFRRNRGRLHFCVIHNFFLPDRLHYGDEKLIRLGRIM
jgi:hypothetical protein